jgi:hypothetical protein
MYLKYITNFNLKATPWFSSPCDYFNWKSAINEKVSNIVDNDNLIIYCVQETYGFRTGIFGLLSHAISNFLPFKTFCLKNIMNSNIRYYQTNNVFSSDGELISMFISKVNRYIPFFNFGTWDYKNNLLLKNFFYENHSIPCMFDFSSPILDSGCGIFSNKKAFLSGYEPLDYVSKISLSDNLSSKGLVWSFFKNYNESKGITIISFNLSDDLFELNKLLELEQIISLKNKLHNQFGLMVKEYETYIIGDFKINFNKDTESFINLTNGLTISYNKTNYFIYQRECPDEGGAPEEKENLSEEPEPKENTLNENVYEENVSNENASDENASDENVSDENVSNEIVSDENVSEEPKFVNIFNPLNNYFKTPVASPSSSSQSSGEWILI